MDTSELTSRLREEQENLRGSETHEARVLMLQAADGIDRLRRECREEHELYLIRTEERDEARAEIEFYKRQLDKKQRHVDHERARRESAEETNIAVYAELLGDYEKVQAQLARAVEVLRYYSDELLYYEPDAPIDGGQSARDLLRDLTVNSIPETLKPE